MSKKNIIIIILIISAVLVFFFTKRSFFSAESRTYSIVLTKDGFSPKEISIRQGDSVVFSSNLGQPFWPASDLHPTHGVYPEFDPRQPVDGASSWSFTFNQAGDWRFHDHLNSLFTGRIKVSGSSIVGKEDCSSPGEKITCWQELLNKTLEKDGLPATFDLVADLYTKEPLFASECHSFVHEIGKFAYGKFKLNQDFELNSKTSYCGYGFYHGFMEILLYTTGDVQQAQDFCKYVGEKLAGDTTDGEGACYHGIGHGAVDGADPSAWGDYQKMLAPAFNMCLSVAGDDHSKYGKLYRCITGAYNSLEILSMSSRYKLFEMQKDPFYICPFQIDEYKEGCYTNMLPALLRFTKNDIQEAEKHVEAIPEQDSFSIRSAVSSSLFHEFIRLNLNAVDYNKITAINICHSLKDPFRLACVEGLSGGHMKYGEPTKAHIKGLAFCSSAELLDDEKDICYNYILARLRLWYSKEKSVEICQSAPVEFRKYCDKL
ncbi:hypothetical protein K8Q98_01620 [Candidatus Nomurabacteria bacterium]|nr:hypothetical protein [Candidatus Nomurabacteria bacterium]